MKARSLQPRLSPLAPVLAGLLAGLVFATGQALAQSGGTEPVVTVRSAPVDIDFNGTPDFTLEFQHITYPRGAVWVMEESTRLIPIGPNLVLKAGTVPAWGTDGSEWDGGVSVGQLLVNEAVVLCRNVLSNPLNPGPSSWVNIVGVSNEAAAGSHSLPVGLVTQGQLRTGWIQVNAVQKSAGTFMAGPSGPVFIPGMFNLVTIGMNAAPEPGASVILGGATDYRPFRLLLDAGSLRLEWSPLSLLDQRPPILVASDPVNGPWNSLPLEAEPDLQGARLFIRLP